jgi:hypothetical protein
MKSKVLQLVLIITVILSESLPAEAQIKRIFTGTWNFECSLAPEGFNTGTIDIQIDSIFTTYSSIKYRFPSIWVKIDGDTLNYIVEVKGENVLYRFYANGQDKLKGNAETPLGPSPLFLTKKEESRLENLQIKNAGILLGQHENQIQDTSSHTYNVWHRQ